MKKGKLKGNPESILEWSLAYPFSVLVLFGINKIKLRNEGKSRRIYHQNYINGNGE
jgi:hypothetical protein